jgi:hypothetical protein
MTDNKGVPQPQSDQDEEKDVEGHNMWISPTINSDMARNRSKDVEREARERNRAKEAKRS